MILLVTIVSCFFILMTIGTFFYLCFLFLEEMERFEGIFTNNGS